MVRRLFLFGLLALLLSGCVESEARLVWRPDGAMVLELRLSGEAAVLEGIAPRLAAQGFSVRQDRSGVRAERPLKAPGWDRVSGWLPGRFAYRDPSGVTLSRTSYLLFEDYRLSGRFVPLEAAGLPPFLAAAPFRFVVEAPFLPVRSNASENRGRIQVWEGRLGDPFEIELVYRLWYPERAAVLALLMGLVLWRRLRRPRAG